MDWDAELDDAALAEIERLEQEALRREAARNAPASPPPIMCAVDPRSRARALPQLPCFPACCVSLIFPFYHETLAPPRTLNRVLMSSAVAKPLRSFPRLRRSQ